MEGKRLHNSSSENKSIGVKLSPSSPHVLSSARHSPTKALANFPGFSTAHGETSSSLMNVSLVSQSSFTSSTNSTSYDADTSVRVQYKTYIDRWVAFYMHVSFSLKIIVSVDVYVYGSIVYVYVVCVCVCIFTYLLYSTVTKIRYSLEKHFSTH